MTFVPNFQILAAGAAVTMASLLAIAHVAAQPASQLAPNATEISTAPAPAASSSPAAAEAAAQAGAEAGARKAAALDSSHLNCMAKVVHHEAANQPRVGQIAVAQVLINRVKHGFGNDVCAVANQPGQFFRLSRYHPDRSSKTWARAMDVARTVMAGEGRDHAKGALYFHANWAKPDRFFRSRTRLARVEDHDFYR